MKHRCYLTLIHPVLEYAASVWSPYLLTLMNRIESVQCRSARFIFNNYGRTSSVTCMVKKLNLPLLSDRRTCNRMITMFKILNGIIHIPTESVVAFNTSQTQGHNYKLHQQPASTNIYTQSFFPHSIKLWNSLPVVVNSLSYYIDNNHRITMDSNRVYNSIDIKIYVAYLYVRDYITSLQYM